MFERVANGWQLAVQSWEVLKLDKELLVFPLMSGIACTLVMVSFALPLWATGFAEAAIEGEGGGLDQARQVLGYVVLFAYYFVNYFVIIFFNSALISCAIIRFKGGDPNLMDGFSAAFSRLPQIVGWALVASLRLGSRGSRFSLHCPSPCSAWRTASRRPRHYLRALPPGNAATGRFA